MFKGKVTYDAEHNLNKFVDSNTGVTLYSSEEKNYFEPLDLLLISIPSNIINLIAKASEDKKLNLHNIKGTLTYKTIDKPSKKITSVDVNIEGHHPGLDEQILKSIEQEALKKSPVLAAFKPEITIHVDFDWKKTNDACCQ